MYKSIILKNLTTGARLLFLPNAIIPLHKNTTIDVKSIRPR